MLIPNNINLKIPVTFIGVCVSLWNILLSKRSSQASNQFAWKIDQPQRQVDLHLGSQNNFQVNYVDHAQEHAEPHHALQKPTAGHASNLLL